MNWMIRALFVGLLWISPAKSRKCPSDTEIRDCFKLETRFIVPDKFQSIIYTKNVWGHINRTAHCIIFLLDPGKNVTNATDRNRDPSKEWPQWETKNNSDLLLITKWHIGNKVKMYVLQGRQCNATVFNIKGYANQADLLNDTGPCNATYIDTEAKCDKSAYNKNYCNEEKSPDDRYIINITMPKNPCINCNNPVKKPEETLDPKKLDEFDLNIAHTQGEDIDAAQAANVMKNMNNLVSINGSSAALTLGEGISGIFVKETEPDDLAEVNFGYTSPNDSMSILEDKVTAANFPRSVSLPKEAFEKSFSSNDNVSFVAVIRFTGLALDEKNSSVLNNEVLGIEMGDTITNLTDTISINFRSVKYSGTPSCHSWNGEGSRPNWTDDGCTTIEDGENITCQCSHLTFFAILMTPPNQTISATDLNTLTTITQVGCGLSMLFLGIVLFMHLLLRKAKASKATRILIHLVSAMFLLNLTFLTNSYVAKMHNSVGCKIMAAAMHYFMLTTFTWFAVNAFHLCLQLHMGGKIVIHRYILKVSLTSWGVPSIVGIVLLSLGKYGEQVIYTTDPNESVSMCWITDSDVHYVVNIGYYALVFIFTFTTFIIMLNWLFCLKRIKADNVQKNKNGKSIVIIMGLCCMLGITWGFAFFAFGVVRISAYYIFTVLNSFQGFFLFIYYYNTSHSGEIHDGKNGQGNTNSSSSNSSTLKTGLSNFDNPYSTTPEKK